MANALLLSDTAELQWLNVGIALAFIVGNIGISTVLRLGLGSSLFIAALRCVGQLAVVAALLQSVFEAENPWVVTLIACEFSPPLAIERAEHASVVLNLLGTIETGKYLSQLGT